MKKISHLGSLKEYILNITIICSKGFIFRESTETQREESIKHTHMGLPSTYNRIHIRKKPSQTGKCMVTLVLRHLSLCYSSAKMTKDKHPYSKQPKPDCQEEKKRLISQRNYAIYSFQKLWFYLN